MMELSRRQLLKAGIAGSLSATLTGCNLLPRKTGAMPEQYSGAIGLPDGSFGVGAIDRNGTLLWQSPMATRGHSGCNRPGGQEVVFFERRPGWSFYVLDANNGARKHHIQALEGEHFVGHGVFSPDGRWLYATGSRYESGEGIITVYDANNSYRRARAFELNGIGPHQLTLHPDGETLVVGLGGILTHPDYDRIKLNLNSMDPALILVNRHSGRITGRFRPPHPHQSTRHVDVSSEGKIYAAYQYQGPLYETLPLLARLENGQLREFRFDDETQARLANYIASVIAHPENDLVAAASPVGGTAIVFEGRTGKLLARASIPDCAGVQALAGGDFLISSGRGKLVRLGRDNRPRELASLPLYWDHHLV
ncbi:DUF1513 domain-containing protein [Marinobacter persicus]|uniref:DUF1513 domain-containing protein n=1 Tax=Marinobacter persicus TaxID=930118 RepID=A0A2S6G9I3_9GAMM|nr:DUF1513 domain-containing protein [Marinobacter persicus]PPK53065.1 hypothetical protein BY455_103139 [Marinobacter persicus]PPK55942.1 hypothetical protein B0H24_1003139 [Marinobacter persicus]PPK59538.1 hypothetical protein BY454_103140 [Marinobacter persicus]